MVVSRRPVSVVVEVSLVSPSPPQFVLCAKKFALHGLVVGVSAKKFALRGHNGPKLVFSGVLGELFRGWGVGGGVLGELFRACRPATATSPSPPLPAGPTASLCGASSTLRIGDGGGFAALGAGCRRVAPLMTPIPPFGGREFVAWRGNVRDQPDASRGRTLITSRRLEAPPQTGRNAWSTWRCCAASTSAARTKSS